MAYFFLLFMLWIFVLPLFILYDVYIFYSLFVTLSYPIMAMIASGCILFVHFNAGNSLLTSSTHQLF